MMKAVVRLVVWVVIILAAAGALGAWALLPRHYPESVTCPSSSGPRMALRRGEGTLTLVLNDCLLSPNGSLDIRAWYDSHPLAPIAEMGGYPQWDTGLWTFTIRQTIDLPPAAAYEGIGAVEGAASLRTVILSQTSYTITW
jgi:hypothetical protein